MKKKYEYIDGSILRRAYFKSLNAELSEEEWKKLNQLFIEGGREIEEEYYKKPWYKKLFMIDPCFNYVALGQLQILITIAPRIIRDKRK